MPPNAHASLGASNAKRWMHCPGSVAAEAEARAGVVGDRSTPHAEEGTLAHDVGEWALRNQRPCSEYPGVDPEMARHVQTYVDAVWAAVDGQARRQLMIETRLSLEDLNPPAPMFGTADAIVFDPAERHVHVLDLKYGTGVYVETEDNPQLLYYALGASLLFARRGEEVERVTVTIVQPRYVGTEPVRSVVYGADYLREFAGTLIAAAWRTQEPNAPRVAGAHCKFCKAGATCPARWGQAQELAQSDFDVIVAPPTPATLSDEQVLRVLDMAPVLEDWLNEVRAFAKRRAETGDPLPGTKLVAGRPMRKWTEEGLNEIVARGYVEEVPMSPAQVEKHVGKKRYANEFAKWQTKESRTTMLVSAHDPRPAITSNDDLTVIPENV